jgi:hypothetical protein
MLAYAEANLRGFSDQEKRPYLCAYVNDNDLPFIELVQARGYQKDEAAVRPLYRLDIPDPFPPIALADGFRLTSLAEECDWAKVHQVMWRGFDHGDDVPMTEEEFDDRRRMFDTPKARRDLKIVVVAPNGDFAAFCGMFFDAAGQFGYVEPVATDPRLSSPGAGPRGRAGRGSPLRAAWRDQRLCRLRSALLPGAWLPQSVQQRMLAALF